MATISGTTVADWDAVGFDENAVNQNLDGFTETFNSVANGDGSVSVSDSTIRIDLFAGGTVVIKGSGFTGFNPVIKSISYVNGDDALTITCNISINLNTGEISGKISSFTVKMDGFAVSVSGSVTLESDGDIVGTLTKLSWKDGSDAYSLSGSFKFDAFGNVDGTVKGFSISLADGSRLSISGVSMPLADLDTVLTVGDLIDMLPAELAGDDVISFAPDGTTLLDGGLGNDTYVIKSAAQTTAEQPGQGNDTVQIAYNVGVNTGVDLAAFANIENLQVTGTGLFDLTGTAENNRLTGNASANEIDGGAGIDTLSGGKGNDTYIVDDALDIVSEKLDQGTDTVESSVTRTLGSNQEHLTLTGATAIIGTGNSLANRITGNDGVNTLAGMSGNDTYVVQTVGDTVVEAASAGTDTVISSVDFALGANVERLVLGDGGLAGTGNAQANRITGGAGNDTLDGGAGNDTLSGGGGDDTYVVDRTGDGVTEALDMGEDSVQSSITFVLGANFENLALTGTAHLNATGNILTNEITGNDGNNILNGGAAGSDTLRGGLGDDTYILNAPSQTLEELPDEGTDLLRIAYAATGIRHEIDLAGYANVENLRVTGTGEFDLTGTAADNVLTGNSSYNIIDGGAGNDAMSGGKGNDTYVVAEAADVVTEKLDEGTDTVESSVAWTLGSHLENLTLTGATAINGTGNGLANRITGNDGVNTLAGMAGNDTYVVQTVGDTVVETSSTGGTDSVISSIDFALGANVERLVLGDGGLAGTGNTQANRITGGAGNDTLDGGAGNDTLSGGGGDDLYFVDRAGDVITEAPDMGEDQVAASVSYKLAANVENLGLVGAALNGTGNGLDNIIQGNALANKLNGSGGNDELTGGDGNDQFIFSTATNALTNVDTITDFTAGQDRLVLDNDVFTKLGAAGALSASRFTIGAAATTTAHRLVYDDATGELYYDSNGSTDGGAVKIAVLEGVAPPALTAADIIVL